MTEETRHAAGGVVLGQPIGRENEWEARIARRREAILLTRKPIDDRVCVARIECILYRRLQRLIVRRHWSVLQTFRHMQPAEAVFVQDEGGVAGDRVESVLVSSWPKLRRFFDREIRLIVAGPFALRRVPPNQFLALTPGLTGRTRARSIIYNAAIARPDEAPAVTQKSFRISRVRLVDFVRAENAGINPAAARGGTVSLQPRITVDLRTVVRFAIAIDAEDYSVSIRLRSGVPSVNFSENGFHVRFAVIIFGIPPIERAKRLIERIVRLLRFCDQTQSELMHKPTFGARVAG